MREVFEQLNPDCECLLRAEGASLVIEPGEYSLGEVTRRIPTAIVFPVEPAPVVDVVDEPLVLSEEPPAKWHQGTRLAGPEAQSINALDSFLPESLVIRRHPGGEPLVEGKDYLVSADFAMVGIGPESAVTPQDTVYASYRYAQMRIDTVMVRRDGSIVLKQGTPDVTVPEPAEVPPGYFPYANVYRPYRAQTLAQEDIFPIFEPAAACRTKTTAGRIPRTLEKLSAGHPVTIVCWGDSVTNGGDASRPEARYVDVFAAGLRERFPQAEITVVNISVDGSSTGQWLYPEENPPVSWQKGIDFSRVIVAKPDLITVEFVNDSWLTREQVRHNYAEIIRRFAELDAECILITPHFIHPKWMECSSLRDAEHREYVLALCEFAEERHLALADAGARWAHLWKEGIPYPTLLKNSLNHPDDRGHRLFAEELWKCFSAGNDYR